MDGPPVKRRTRIVDALVDTSDAWIGALALLAILGILGVLCCFGIRFIPLATG